jgi:hypothetical protein
VALIPQVFYIASYVNTDMYSLALSAVLAHAGVRWLKNPDSFNTNYVAVICGLFATAKYNYALYAYLYVAMLWLAHKWLGRPGRVVYTLAIRSMGMVIVLAGPWYWRNAVLYHDPLGQRFMLALMARINPPVYVFPFSLFSWIYLGSWHWFDSVTNSFFSPNLSSAQLVWLSPLMALLAVSLCVYVLRNLDRRAQIVWDLMGLFVVGNILLMGWSSLTIDFQAQGRYLYPVLVPLTLMIAWLWKRDARIARFVAAFGGIVAAIFVMSVRAWIQTSLRTS